MDVSTLCRSCMKNVASWEKGNFDQTAVDMFCFCTNIKITDDDKLPRQFCYDCFIKMESSYTFIREAQRCNNILRNIVSRDQTSVIVETESLLKSYTPTAYTPKSVSLSLPDYEISNYSNFQDESFFPEQQLKEVCVSNDQPNCELNEPNNMVMQDFQYEYNEFTQNHDSGVPGTSVILPTNTLQTENVVTVTEVSKVKRKVLKKADEKLKNHSCPICKKGFTFKAWLDRHLEREHSGSKYACKECNKSFAKPHQLKVHAVTHTAERTFVCGVCDARFQKRKQLVAHCGRHSNARPFKCAECGARFKDKSILKTHIKLHSSEKAFMCSVCGRSFIHASNLKVHMRVHTGAKPYECNECNFKSASVSSLRRHVSRHRRAPAHRCMHCEKMFYDASGLARHERTHTGLLPFRCAECGRRFIDSWKRKTHLMRRHQMALHDIPRLDRNGDRVID